MKKLLLSAALLALCTAPLLALDGKALYSEKKCGMCHGMDGNSTSKMFPSLAGKAADFLAAETMKIKSGERKGRMTVAMKNNAGVKHLSEAEALAIGEYLASVK